MKIKARDFRVYLDLLTAGDAEDFAREINDPDIIRGVSNPDSPIPYPYTKEHAEKFIRSLGDAHLQGRMVSFAIRDANTNAFMGSMGVGEIDQNNKRCEILYWLGKQYWGKGYAKEAVRLALYYAFMVLKLNKVKAVIYSDNERSVGLLGKFGFAVEGKLRQEVYLSKERRFIDVMLLSLLKEDYRDDIAAKAE